VNGDADYLLTRPHAAGIVPVETIPADIVELSQEWAGVDVTATG